MGRSNRVKAAAVSETARTWAEAQVKEAVAAGAGSDPAGLAKARAAADARSAANAAARRAGAGPAAERAAGGDEAFEAQERRRVKGLGYAGEEADEGSRLTHVSLGTARRVLNRDGVGWLAERGWLTGVFGKAERRSPDDWMRGSVRAFALARYREAYEAASLAVGSALAAEKVMGAGCGGAATSDRYVAAWAEAGQRAVALGLVDKAVLAAWPGGRELLVLRRVGGLGETARSMAANGRDCEAVVAALLRAADVAAWVFRAPGFEVLELAPRARAAVADVLERRRRALADKPVRHGA